MLYAIFFVTIISVALKLSLLHHFRSLFARKVAVARNLTWILTWKFSLPGCRIEEAEDCGGLLRLQMPGRGSPGMD